MDTLYDVAVIGGGPAGMMAAGRAAELGARVVLLEKNADLGRKLLITGGGRCNILNAERDMHLLTAKYGKKGKTLFSALSQFGVQDTWDFFEGRGLPLKVEAENRAFPQSDKAEDVFRTMLAYLKEGKVEVRRNTPVIGFGMDGGKVTAAFLKGADVKAKTYILATGGKSRPETGSTGDGFQWLRKLGHTVTQSDPALVPVMLSDAWVASVAGISLKDVKLTVFLDGQKQESNTGKMLFTHTGLSGPLVLNMSKRIGSLLQEGAVTLELDLYPALDEGALDRRLLQIFEAGKNKMIKNHIGELTLPRLGHTLLTIAGIDGDTPLRQLTREQRIALGRTLKHLRMHVKGLLGPDKAVVTGGGAVLSEVDFKTMRSKKVLNLALAGDILDFDRPSGGFSLQICWTTGYVAGSAAV